MLRMRSYLTRSQPNSAFGGTPTLSECMVDVASALASLALPALTGIAAWLANEWRKRAVEDRARREERYRALLLYSRGFYVESFSQELMTKSVEEVKLSWIYCPDSVIRTFYTFLDTVHEGSGATSEQRNAAFNEIVAAMRRDLRALGSFSRSKLSANDYRHFGASAHPIPLSPQGPPNEALQQTR